MIRRAKLINEVMTNFDRILGTSPESIPKSFTRLDSELFLQFSYIMTKESNFVWKTNSLWVVFLILLPRISSLLNLSRLTVIFECIFHTRNTTETESIPSRKKGFFIP